MSSNRQRATVSSLIWVASGLISAAVAAIGLTVWGFRSDAVHDAVNDVDNLATVLAEQTARSIQAIDLTLTELQQRFVIPSANGGDDPHRLLRNRDVHELLSERANRLPQAAVITLADSTGHIIGSSRGWPAERIDISDREFFQFLKTHPDAGLYVSAPVASRVSGLRTVFFARRLSGADGFGGLAILGVELSYFRLVYDSIASLHDKSFLLLRGDGTILVRQPDTEQRTGLKMPPASPWYERVAQGGGTYHSLGFIDGFSRLVAARLVPGYPLVVNVSVREATALATWQRRATLIGFGTLLAILCSALLLRQLAKQFRRLLDSEASLADRETRLAQKSRELEQANARLDTAISNMSQGLLLFDSSTRIVVCNRRYIEMYGLSADVVRPGLPFRDLITHRKQTGSFAGDIDEYCATLMQALAKGQPGEFIAQTANGRSIRIVNHPLPDGAWVATHEDVTEERRLEQERDRDREFLNNIVNATPTPIIVKTADGRRYTLINEAGLEYVGLAREEILGKTAQDIWPKEAAELIAAHDQALLLSDGQLQFDEHPIDTPSKGLRIITSKRFVIRDCNGKPEYLLTVAEDVTERKRSEAQIVHMAHHDLLTGLPNRALFTQKIDEAGARLRRWGEPFTVFILDLDRFKIVNDSLGHPAGDALLKETAARLSSALRETDVLARLGGDEFAIIQAGETNQAEAAATLAGRIINTIKSPYLLEGNEATVGTSIGIAMAPADGSEPTELIKKADLALYRTKSLGRNGYRFFDAQMTRDVDARHLLENDLRGAVARNELEVFYQPIIDIKTRKLFGAEALVRWRHPHRGLVLPDQFIPLAEETGLIASIGEWVLQRGCADAAKWPAQFKVAINLSALQFRKSNLFDIILCALLESGLAPRRLELEITESTLLESDTDPLAVIRRLKNLGVSIALDDFGTGYSSLSYLTKFPFDKIKIDKSFTQNLTKRAECAAIISSVRALGVGLNILTVAEGVETEQQFGILRAAGVDQAQGYLFGRPRPLSEVDFSTLDPEKPLPRAA